MKALVQLFLVGWLAYVPLSHSESTPAASDERVSTDQPLRSGVWRYRVASGGATRWCVVMDGPSTTFGVVVENESDETLHCSMSIATSRQLYENVAVIEPRGRQLGLSVCASGETLESATADCKVRQPPLPWDVRTGCHYSVVSAQPIDYPPGSVRKAEQAPVYVSFSVPEREGRPKDVAVATSSGYERLDEAAVRHVKRMKMRTSCPGVHYRMRISFRLDEHGQPMEP